MHHRVSKSWGFPLFSGKVRIVSRSLSGLFLVGAVNVGRERGKGRIGKIPGQIGENPKKSGKSPKWEVRKRVYLGNGNFELERERGAHFSEDWQVACFCQRCPTFFIPFSSSVAETWGLFTDSQSAHLQSTRVRTS